MQMDSTPDRPAWSELPAESVDFCCRLADVAALQYSRHLLHFAAEGKDPARGEQTHRVIAPHAISSPDFSTLCDVFCSALRTRLVGDESSAYGRSVQKDGRAELRRAERLSRPATACGNTMVNPARSILQPSHNTRRVSRSTSPPAERDSSAKLRRSITKRMPSFLRGHKTRSESVGGGSSSSSGVGGGGKKKKSLKKEGVLHQLVDVAGGQIQWAKCRVVVKKDQSGHVISFYSPPKSTKPRSGVLCFLINEVRPTTAGELPDYKHSFVIKGMNGMEYILDCSSDDEMTSWVRTIRTCSQFDSGINSGVTSSSMRTNSRTETAVSEAEYDEAEVSPMHRSSLRRHSIASPARMSCHSASSASRKSSCSGNSGNLLRHGGSSSRLSTASLPALRTSSHSALPVTATLLCQTQQQGHGNMESHAAVQQSLDSTLSDGFLRSPDEPARYVQDERQAHRTASAGSNPRLHPAQGFGVEVQPWFHGQLTRQEAAALVCHGGASSHGTFLVRESESREGTMVLSFNCEGKAKHLRMAVQPDKTVKVQDWLFDNVFHAIDYFKVHPVPLESIADSEVLLTSYVVAQSSHRASSIMEEEDQQLPHCSPPHETLVKTLHHPEQHLQLQRQMVALPLEPHVSNSASCTAGKTGDGALSTTEDYKYDKLSEVDTFPELAVDLPPAAGKGRAAPPVPGHGVLHGAPEPGRPRTYFIDGTGFHTRNSYVVAN